MPELELLFELEGLGCANCAAKIERRVQELPEISRSEVNFMQQSLRVVLQDKKAVKSVVPQIEAIVHTLEPDVIVKQRERLSFLPDSLLADSQKKEMQIRRLRIQMIVGAMIYTAAFVHDRWGAAANSILLTLYLTAYLILGFPVLFKAVSNILKGKVFDENFLMAIATIGALVISQRSEAVAVMLFYQIGELFQMTAVHRSRRSISELLSIRPDYANIQKAGSLIKVRPESVAVGDFVVVKPGEKVPLDGVVRKGCGAIDTSALTGESVLREVEPGDPILSGCINKNGVLTIEVTASFGESTVSKIIEMVSNAGSKKTKSENLISRFAGIYTPIVVVAAVLLAVVPPVFFGGDFSVWVYRALSFLVISCPCALVVSVPLGYFGGIGAASKRGILIKGSNFLDVLGRADSVIFDKTGTLTKGEFIVSDVLPAGNLPGASAGDRLGMNATASGSEDDLLRLAAMAEWYSDHPIAHSVRRAAEEKGISGIVLDSSQYKEIAGRGISVHTPDGDLLVGNRKLMMESDVKEVPEIMTVGTILFVAVDRRFAGYLEISDEVRPEASKVIEELKNLHISNIAMLTGDHAASADKVAGELGITEVFSELLPSQKLEKIEEIFARRNADPTVSGSLVFVGDGINDAPVLVRADIGIAIGAMASGAAIEAADIVIMTDDMEALPKAIHIARKTRRIIMENIIFALSIKGIILLLAALGLTNLWFAIFADVGVAVLAIMNSVRAGR